MKTYENTETSCWDVRIQRRHRDVWLRSDILVIQVIERHWYDARNKAARILGESDIMRLDVTPSAKREWHAYP